MKEQLDRIEAKLDRVIKAMQEYDGLDEDFNEPEVEYAWKRSYEMIPEEVGKLEVLPKKKKYYKPKNKKNESIQSNSPTKG